MLAHQTPVKIFFYVSISISHKLYNYELTLNIYLAVKAIKKFIQRRRKQKLKLMVRWFDIIFTLYSILTIVHSSLMNFIIMPFAKCLLDIIWGFKCSKTNSPCMERESRSEIIICFNQCAIFKKSIIAASPIITRYSSMNQMVHTLLIHSIILTS